MDLSQHAAYLKGLAEGKGLTEDALKGDFVKALLSCLEDMAEEIESLEEYVHELTEYAEAIDEDLGDIEEVVFDEFDDDDAYFDDDDIFVETECPVCGETVGYYQGDYDEPVEVLCPNCDAVVAVLGKDDEYEEVEDDEIVLDEELAKTDSAAKGIGLLAGN